ncbi:hypothetical protein [Metabacillus arenae]|uniref:Uncharacterized protein n=1 Tax=Metabacillus arenae TaxID=2771434 RepID=A0A926NE67_9BACI|nr:hypothetical protein [Metabacillus arenae]MBD1379200.1 hypothetical protein [Metabacillus arenae]
MGKLLNFQKEENCDCEICELVNEYGEIIQDADSLEELHSIIAELISEARSIGYKDALMQDVQNKMNILDEIHGVCNCDECDEDNCPID